MSQFANLNLFTRLNPEGSCSQANKVAFQTMNFTPRTSKEIVDNMKRLNAIAADPNNPAIEYGKPFYLPCILTEANEVNVEAATIDHIMQVDGKVVPIGPGDESEEDDDPL